MFSDHTIALIKATVPLLKDQGEAITRHFYALMFREHPEVKGFFNQAHQAEGTQARALANAVLAYASHIDRLDEIAPALPRIIQKHVSLGVQAEHYPIVGKCLLQGIREVLGSVATDEILNAWAEAYGALAQLLIDAEAQVYADRAAQTGGWRGTRALKLIRKEAESAVITSFYFEAADGRPLMRFDPGQYLTLVLDLAGESVRRNYSLSDAPDHPWYRISVKREPGGRVSTWLHDELQVGMTVHAHPPAGDFRLDPASQRPVVLVTGGVGITPAMSMLEALAPTGRPVQFVHAAQDSAVQAFRPRVDALATAHPNVSAVHCYGAPTANCPPHVAGRVSEDLLARALPADRDVDLYFLGPKPFMQSVYAMARSLGVPAGQIRYEFFGPLQAITGG